MNAPSIHIRDAVRADTPFLVECNAAMALETERKTLDAPVLARGVAAVFEDPRRGRYFLAEQVGESAGCLLITHEWSDWRGGDWWWIQSVYVLPSHRRHGVFRALYAEVMTRARRSGAIGLRLYVEQHNARAQATYRALGMMEEPYRILSVTFTEPA